MIARFKQSWELFKTSITVTFQHRKLLWFPGVTTLLTLIIALFFLSAMSLPIVLHHTGYHLNQKEHWVALKDYYLTPATPHATAARAGNEAPEAGSTTPAVQGSATGSGNENLALRGSPWISFCAVAIYFLSMFLATFFNVAFYSEIMAALDGRGVSLRRGLSTARSRWRSILGWSLLAGVVGWLIRALEQRLPLAGRIIAGLVGLAWSIAAIFAIPVIIQEPALRNPIRVLQHSAQTLKRTWGEGLIGYLGFHAGTLIIFLTSLVPLIVAGAISVMASTFWPILIVGCFWLLAMICIAYVSGVAGHVYRCALFKYAVEGVVPEPYNQELLNRAWKVKKSAAEA